MSEPTWPIPWQPVVGDRGGALAFAEAQLARGTLWLLGALPVGAQATFATLAARAARRLDRRHSDAAREFLTQAFGAKLSAEERERRVLDTWKFFFTMLA
ncbi:MAG TPA: hypothetical protein VM509_00995, partial [Planctomycetota bacterium]|nr:hypothetical protein [Planctomycetota bacterium]